jgi:peptidoglycan/LPS O-acetylase OafA/YrhL
VPPPQSQTPATTNPTFHLGYRPELDGVRGISILLVLGLHFTPRLIPGGYFGVEVFFVLSGFLITSLLLQEWERTRSINLRDFYFRRGLRLGPALLVYLLLLGGYAFVFLDSEHAAEIYNGILLTLSYVSNWVIALKPAYPPGILTITWSLAVEEQFYLLWPLILFALLNKKVSRRWIIVIILLGLTVIVLHRTWLWQAGASFRRLYYATDTRADGLMLGCLIGCLVSWGLVSRSRLFELSLKVLALVAILFLGYLVFTIKSSNPILFKGVFALASLAIAVVLMVLVVWPGSPPFLLLRFPPLVWIGRISYGLYLWHWPVRGYIFGASSQPTNRQIITALVLSFVITTISFYFVEQPFLTLKKRLSHA